MAAGIGGSHSSLDVHLLEHDQSFCDLVHQLADKHNRVRVEAAALRAENLKMRLHLSEYGCDVTGGIVGECRPANEESEGGHEFQSLRAAARCDSPLSSGTATGRGFNALTHQARLASFPGTPKLVENPNQSKPSNSCTDPLPGQPQSSITPANPSHSDEELGSSPSEFSSIGSHEALPTWKEKPSISKSTLMSGAMVKFSPTISAEVETMVVRLHNGFLTRFISYPSNPRRLAWDFAGAGLILYDLIAIPLQVFEPPASFFSTFMDWFTLVFWTVNIFMSFLVGFVKDGVTIMIPSVIAMEYLKFWFVIDCLVVVPDWVFTIAAQGGGKSDAGSSVKLLRALRLIRMIRLVRLLKLRKVLSSISDMIDSEYASILANILKMIVLVLIINHVLSCAWYVVGNSTQFGDSTWLKYHDFDDVSWSYQYATAFHWSITQFTPSSMHVQPQNVQERVFAILVVVFALVVFSYVVGSITGSLTQLRNMSSDAAQQFWNLRRYLKQNNVSAALSARVQKFLEHAWQNQKTSVSIEGLKIIQLLSEQLFSELRSEIYVPVLKVHPLFEQLAKVSQVSMQRLANTAISRKSLARSDSLFHAAESATHMIIVMEGRLWYNRICSKGIEHPEVVDKCEDWISEPVLWTDSWVHRGGCHALTVCALTLVNPGKFGETIKLNPIAHNLACTYARSFVDWLNAQPWDRISDIWQGEDIGDTVRGFMQIQGEEEQVATGDKKEDLGLRASTSRLLQRLSTKPLAPAWAD